MDIKWAYYLIALIYILVSLLRVINSTISKQFQKENEDSIKVFAIKKDFFLTVSCICILATCFINGSALVGGKPINQASILITVLVIGFTVLNSCLNIYASKEKETVLLLGYLLEQGEIEGLKIKERKKFAFYDITFTKEIDSYNYTKLILIGKNRNEFQTIIKKLAKEN